jgi:hypothetical protein
MKLVPAVLGLVAELLVINQIHKLFGLNAMYFSAVFYYVVASQ